MSELRKWTGPMWWKRLRFRFFPGRWTQAEVDDINRRGHERWLALQPFLEHVGQDEPTTPETRRAETTKPIPNWALVLVRDQPETECVAIDGTVLARSRSQPMIATGHGIWKSIRQGPLRIELSTSKRVCPGDTLTFDVPDIRALMEKHARH